MQITHCLLVHDAYLQQVAHSARMGAASRKLSRAPPIKVCTVCVERYMSHSVVPYRSYSSMLCVHAFLLR
jgi:hypothetical protein